MSYKFLPEGKDYIPVLEAASLLAFGDRDYEKYYQLVWSWGEPEMSPQNAAEIKRSRQKEIEKEKSLGIFFPEKYVELDDFGRRKISELYYPEVKRELNRLQQLAAQGKITIIALRYNAATRSIGSQYKAIPAEFFKFNEWMFWGLPDFAIAKPYDQNTRSGGTSDAEWFYPAVAESEIEELYQQTPRCGGLAGEKGKYSNDPLDEAIKAITGSGKIPLKTCQWDEFCYLVRDHGKALAKERGWSDRTIKRRLGLK